MAKKSTRLNNARKHLNNALRIPGVSELSVVKDGGEVKVLATAPERVHQSILSITTTAAKKFNLRATTDSSAGQLAIRLAA